MSTFRRQPVVVAAALAALIDALITFAMSMGWVAPEVGGPIMTVVTASVGMVKAVVSPVEKVAKLIDKPVEVTNSLLRKITP